MVAILLFTDRLIPQDAAGILCFRRRSQRFWHNALNFNIWKKSQISPYNNRPHKERGYLNAPRLVLFSYTLVAEVTENHTACLLTGELYGD
jgi:hypothetical protein